ncbi:MAG: fructose-6-phosphate aldolase [Candidatus Altiarchaeota archaeon]|nr:fructose-6-phosphate aldolase [Candidatus Altiarchaeota archaeon]
MKIFIDTANIEEIKEANSWGILDGVTTNPTLVSREKRDFKDLVMEIISIVDGPISVEVIGLESHVMVEEARDFSKLSDNVVVKIPMTKEGLKAVKVLSSEGVKTNVTLVFTANQGLLAAKAGATYVSPFIGRLDDIGFEGMEVVRDLTWIFETYDYETDVIVASIRHPMHVIEAAKSGAGVATIPFKVLDQMFKHPLTDAGIDRFLADWKALEGKDD